MRPWILLLLFLAPPLWVLGRPSAPAPEPRAEPPLVRAAEAGDLARLEALLDGSESVDLRDACRWTPLMKAARNGHVEVVRRLLAEGAEVDAEDKGGYTALLLAAGNGHAEVVRLLLQAGADPGHRERTRGWTALDWARREGHREVVSLLEGTPRILDRFTRE